MSNEKPIYEVNVFDSEQEETLVDNAANGFFVVTTHKYEKDGQPFRKIEGMMHNLSSVEICEAMIWALQQDPKAKLAFEKAFRNLMEIEGGDKDV